MITFKCTNCGLKVKTEDRFAGKNSKCPKCGNIVKVPTPDAYSDKSSIIKFRCPSCRQKIGLTKNYAGKLVKCAKCKEPFTVPNASEPPTPKLAHEESTILGVSESLDSINLENFAEDEFSVGELTFQPGPAPVIPPPAPVPSAPPEDEYQLAPSQDYTLQNVDTLPTDTTDHLFIEPPKTNKSTGYILGAIGGILTLALLVSFLLIFLNIQKLTTESEKQTEPAKQLAEEFITAIQKKRYSTATELFTQKAIPLIAKSELKEFASMLSKPDDISYGNAFVQEHEGQQEIFYNCTLNYKNDSLDLSFLMTEENGQVKNHQMNLVALAGSGFACPPKGGCFHPPVLLVVLKSEE